jgi:hypothetical protein
MPFIQSAASISSSRPFSPVTMQPQLILGPVASLSPARRDIEIAWKKDVSALTMLVEEYILLVGDSRRGLMSKEERVAEVRRISQSPAPVITLRNCTYDWTWRSVQPSWTRARKAFKPTEGQKFIIQLQVCGPTASAFALAHRMIARCSYLPLRSLWGPAFHWYIACIHRLIEPRGDLRSATQCKLCALLSTFALAQHIIDLVRTSCS